MDKLKKYFFKRYIRKISHTPRYISWDDASTVVALFHSSTSDIAEAEKIIAHLTAQGKQVAAYYFNANQRRPIASSLKQIHILTTKDFNLLGRPCRNRVVLAESANIVLDLTMYKTLAMSYIAVTIESAMICGAAPQADSVMRYDFQIDIEQNTENTPTNLLSQIEKYLKIIKSEK